jgi:hypothetical protein
MTFVDGCEIVGSAARHGSNVQLRCAPRQRVFGYRSAEDLIAIRPARSLIKSLVQWAGTYREPRMNSERGRANFLAVAS